MAQFARPTATASGHNFTVVPASGVLPHEAVDESTLDDTDYVESPSNPTNEDIEFTLGSITDPAVDSGHSVVVVLGKDSAGGGTIDAVIKLIDNTDASTIVTHNEPDVGSGANTVTINLTAAQAAAIASAAYGGQLSVNISFDQST